MNLPPVDNWQTGTEFNTVDNWFIDSDSQFISQEEGSIWGNLWDWVNTDAGVYTIRGAIGGLKTAWDKDKRTESAESLMRLRASLDADLIRLKDELAGPSEAELKDARISRHNRSINTPMNMSVRNR